jgi:hypothetical protein
VDAARQVAQFGERALGLVVRLVQQCPGLLDLATSSVPVLGPSSRRAMAACPAAMPRISGGTPTASTSPAAAISSARGRLSTTSNGRSESSNSLAPPGTAQYHNGTDSSANGIDYSAVASTDQIVPRGPSSSR